MQILCVLERIVCSDPHQLFTFFLVLLHSRMLSRLCRIPLLRENLCCARLTVSALGVLHAALRQPRNHRCFRPQQCAQAHRLTNGCVCGRRRQRRRDLLPRGGQRFAVPFAPRGTREGSPWRSLLHHFVSDFQPFGPCQAPGMAPSFDTALFLEWMMVQKLTD